MVTTQPKQQAPPKFLDAEAQKQWTEYVTQVAARDYWLLAVFCATYSSWVATIESVRKEGTTVEHRGALVANPDISVVERLADKLLLLGDKLRLTPSSRAKDNYLEEFRRRRDAQQLLDVS